MYKYTYLLLGTMGIGTSITVQIQVSVMCIYVNRYSRLVLAYGKWCMVHGTCICTLYVACVYVHV